jgi:O-antigen/teichoic acid export membrane protein
MVNTGRHIRTLGSEAVVYGIAGTIGRFINVLLIPIYTRALPPDEYGLFGIALSLLALLTLVLGAMDNAAGRWFFDSEQEDQRQRVVASWFWFQMGVGAVAMLICFVVARPIAATWLNSSSNADLVILVAGLAWVSILGKVLSNWFRWLRRPIAAVCYSLVSTLTTSGLIALFVAVRHRGVRGALEAQIMAGSLFFAVALVILKQWVSPRRIARVTISEMFRFTLPIFPATLAAWATANADRLVMPLYLSNAQVGLYFLAFQIASVVSLIDLAFQMAWSPFAMSILNDPGATAVYARMLSLYGFLGAWVCTGVALFAPIVLSIMSAPAYGAAASSVPFLAFFFFAIGLTNVVGIGALLTKRSAPIAKNIFISAIVSTVLLFPLVPLIGRNGAGLAKMIGMWLAVAYMYRACQKLYPIPYRVVDLVASVILSWTIIGAATFIPHSAGWTGLAIRALLCLTFVPLAFGLGLVRRNHVRLALLWIRKRTHLAPSGG